MPAFVGLNTVISWTTSSATAVMSGDYRTFTYTPAVDLLEETAGSDANKLYIAAQKDGQIAFTGLLQSVGSAGGTIMTAALIEGQVGTLVFSPEGTAAGKTKFTYPAISQGAALNAQYNGVTEVSVNWQQNGARVEGTN